MYSGFDALGAQNDEDSQPDPDGHIMLESGHGRVWLVKVSATRTFTQPNKIVIPESEIPNGVMVKIRHRGVQLAKICIYDVPPGAAPRIVVLVPPEDGSGGDEDI